MKLNIDKSALNGAKAYISGLSKDVLDPKVKAIVKKNAFNMEGYAKNNIRNNKSVVTARLFGSINTQIVNNGFKGIVGTNVFYATYVEFGRGKVRPIRAKALKIPIGKKGIKNYSGAYIKQGGEKFIFRKSVAPSKKKPYLIPSFDKTVKEFTKDIERLG